jgi:hypothetical protein
MQHQRDKNTDAKDQLWPDIMPRIIASLVFLFDILKDLAFLTGVALSLLLSSSKKIKKQQ